MHTTTKLLLIVTLLSTTCRVQTKERQTTFKNVTIVAFAYPTLQLVLKNVQTNTLNDTLFFGYHTIKVNNQNIPRLPSGCISSMETVKTIIMDANNITQIETRALENLPALTELRITKNNFYNLTFRAVSCKKLQVLYLNNNNITFVDEEAFMDLPDLRILNMEGNKITVIEAVWFKYTPNLYEIFLSGNKISQINKGTFRYLKGTRNVSDVLQNIAPNIYLENNGIKTIRNGAFEGPGEIYDLFLNNNELETISVDTFRGLKNVHWLNLMNNKLKCLQEEDYGVLIMANITHLDGNLWECDCLDKIVEWAKNIRRTVFANVSLVKCLKLKLQYMIDSEQ